MNDRPPDRTINEPPASPTDSPDPGATPEQQTPPAEKDPGADPGHVNTSPKNR